MKKKLLSTLLALALCGTMSLTAFAADTTVNENTQDPKTGSTDVKFDVAPTYTITIPEKVELTKNTDNGVKYIGTGTVKANEGLRLKADEKIEVRLTNCDYKLDAGKPDIYELPYTVKAGTKDVTTADNLVATFTTEKNATDQESLLTFTADDPKYAGIYSDTVTFTVAVVKK